MWCYRVEVAKLKEIDGGPLHLISEYKFVQSWVEIIHTTNLSHKQSFDDEPFVRHPNYRLYVGSNPNIYAKFIVHVLKCNPSLCCFFFFFSCMCVSHLGSHELNIKFTHFRSFIPPTQRKKERIWVPRKFQNDQRKSLITFPLCNNSFDSSPQELSEFSSNKKYPF